MEAGLKLATMTDDGPSTVVPSDWVSVPNGRRLSQSLTAIACDGSRDRTSVSEIADTSDHRAFGARNLIILAPNALLVSLLGHSAILGTLRLFMTWLLATGRPHPWIPAATRIRSFRREDVQRPIEWAVASAALVASVFYGLATAAPFVV